MVMGQSVKETEVVVIGAGPGGYVAAIRLAQLGYDVVLVDKAGELGGMCLHHGCIPSKALIHATYIYDEVRHAEELGIAGELSIDFGKTQSWKKGVIDTLFHGIEGLCKKHGIEVVTAAARFQNPNQVLVEGEGLDFNVIEFRHAIIATGSRPRQLDAAPFGGRILSSRELLEIDHVPQSLCVVGGGYIGIELGVMLAKAGAKVTVLEASDTILGVVEPDLVTIAKKRLDALGVEVITGAAVDHAESREGDVLVRFAGQERSFEYALVSVGHAPVTEGLQLDLAGVAVNERGFVTVDEQMRTSQSHIFAVGDVVGGMMLAHKASAEGRVAAAALSGKPVAFDAQCIPAVIFSDPEIATVGMRESEAREKYGDAIRVASFPFSGLGKALAIHQKDGFVKLVTTEEGVLLGAHAVGPGVTDYISEAALAIEMGATAEDIALTIHPHPTLGEIMSEAAEAVMGEAIHLYQPKQ